MKIKTLICTNPNEHIPCVRVWKGGIGEDNEECGVSIYRHGKGAQQNPNTGSGIMKVQF